MRRCQVRQVRQVRLATPVTLMTLMTLVLLLVAAGDSLAQRGRNAGQDIQKVIPMRERVQIMQGFWDWKKQNVLPAIMREQGVDMWIVRNDEQPEYRQTSYREGPFYTSLLPANHEGMVLPSRYDEGLRIPELLLFFDAGEQIEYVQPRDYAHIGELVRARDPRVIAISETDNGPMLAALGEYAGRTVGSWALGVRWLETMGPAQISVYRYVQGVANDLIAEGFSNKVITPDVTTSRTSTGGFATGCWNYSSRRKTIRRSVSSASRPTSKNMQMKTRPSFSVAAAPRTV